MSERDAFGRADGEDTLAGMGWREPTFTATIAGAPTAAAPLLPATAELPALAPTRTHPQPPSPPAPVRRRSGRRRGGPRVMTRLLFLGIMAASILFALRAGTDVLGDIEDVLRGRTTTRTIPLEGSSLIRASALAAALKGLPDGDVERLRVAPDRIDATVIVDGRRHAVRVTAGGRVFDLQTPGAKRGATVRVNTAAPARIVRTATRRAGRRPGSVSYLVLMTVGGRSEWQLFFEDGLQFSASASGRTVRRVSG